jgi:outer membrane assembly lipoprotein YfgL
MIFNNFKRLFGRGGLTALAVCMLAACASGSDSLKPADLGPNPGLLGVRLAWSGKVGLIDFPLQVKANGAKVVLADGNGSVVSLDAHTGAEQWRVTVGGPISAGVGSDGRFSAVVTRNNELVMLDEGQLTWRFRLTSQVFTAPLVAGERVFVLGADRSLSAFDAKTGRKLWQQQRPGDALVLRQAGVLIAVGNTLVAGLSGHLVGMNPLNGNVIWDAPVATPRGTNDIERLVDLVGDISRESDVVCVRAFQTAVGCIDTARGTVNWKKSSVGAVGLHGDDKQVYGVQADGHVMAWRRADGELIWSSDRLRYRQLSAPLVLGRSVMLGDEQGVVHLLARLDGTPLTRLTTDGSAIKVTPVSAGGSMVVITRNGGVFGFQPE